MIRAKAGLGPSQFRVVVNKLTRDGCRLIFRVKNGDPLRKLNAETVYSNDFLISGLERALKMKWHKSCYSRVKTA